MIGWQGKKLELWLAKLAHQVQVAERSQPPLDPSGVPGAHDVEQEVKRLEVAERCGYEPPVFALFPEKGVADRHSIRRHLLIGRRKKQTNKKNMSSLGLQKVVG